MKQSLLLLILLLSLNFSNAQEQTTASQETVKFFIENYNAGNFEEIYSAFSSQMQRTLPKKETNHFLASLRSEAGKVKDYKFSGYLKESWATYNTRFEYEKFQLHISSDKNSKINGLLIKPIKKENMNSTNLILPFKNEWYVGWGGDTEELNYHVKFESQKHAFDFLVMNDNGRSYLNEGTENDDFYAFGKEIISPASGKIVSVVDGIHDNKPGETNKMHIPGNSVTIKTAKNEFLFFAHLKQGSIQVKVDEEIKQGDVIALCGNSGNSTEPHLHFQIQTNKYIDSGSTLKSFFKNIEVNGTVQKDYSPIKGDRIKNIP
ncbi:DUF3887 domain-containing protein [Christiangramia portivictoriae]|uniref:DUF3887 domain-containing protein n=1 Tax=Christiangramia portivictoriae TaxID=326069 RepID=UPI0004144306|nr:peptidoglycan DD-metalloendopeptidase family protein [Christiangramia portivictoriae]